MFDKGIVALVLRKDFEPPLRIDLAIFPEIISDVEIQRVLSGSLYPDEFALVSQLLHRFGDVDGNLLLFFTHEKENHLYPRMIGNSLDRDVFEVYENVFQC